MAIDTAAKRRSASGILTGIVSVAQTPDAAQPVAWRQNAGWGYVGIPATPIPPGSGVLLDATILGGAGTWGTPPGTLGGSF